MGRLPRRLGLLRKLIVAHVCPVKKLDVYDILVYTWFVAKILAANKYPSTSLTDSCQIFSQVWAEDSLAKILASQFTNIW
jgi:hypothetical protein